MYAHSPSVESSLITILGVLAHGMNILDANFDEISETEKSSQLTRLVYVQTGKEKVNDQTSKKLKAKSTKPKCNKRKRDDEPLESQSEEPQLKKQRLSQDCEGDKENLQEPQSQAPDELKETEDENSNLSQETVETTQETLKRKREDNIEPLEPQGEEEKAPPTKKPKTEKLDEVTEPETNNLKRKLEDEPSSEGSRPTKIPKLEKPVTKLVDQESVQTVNKSWDKYWLSAANEWSLMQNREMTRPIYSYSSSRTGK